MKYPPLEEPCKSCLGCIRLEEPIFIKDENCKYRENLRMAIIEKLGIQERIKI